jgi:hypothetical protein
MLRVEQNDGPISFAVEQFSQGQDVWGTGITAQLASFAAVKIDNNSTTGHKKPPGLDSKFSCRLAQAFDVVTGQPRDCARNAGMLMVRCSFLHLPVH